MKYQVRGGHIYLFDLFDLSATLQCGQCFRWEAAGENRWQGVAFGRQLTLRQSADTIIFENTSPEDFLQIWAPYFDLYTDYGQMHRQLCQNPLLRDILLSCAGTPAQGLHILRQDPWEALCSFILSQNNNIPRIQKIIRSLCALFGEEIAPGAFSFPSYQQLAGLSLEDLAPIRSGFRAKYILDAAKKLCRSAPSLQEIQEASLPDARFLLRQIKGVGPKVAECALLYGFHRLEAFPMDVWMFRAMASLFPGAGPQDFGGLAGVAQQYIYHYSRQNPHLFSV